MVQSVASGAASVASQKPQPGSPVSWVYRIILLVLIIILIVVLLVVIYFASQMAEHGATLNPSTWDDAAISYFETQAGLTDTGDGAGESFLTTLFWSSPIGLIGGAIGLAGDKSGWGGVGQAWSRSNNSRWTFFKRILGY